LKNKPDLDLKREAFAEAYEEIYKDRQVIFLDETTFNSWIASDRAWSHPNQPVYQIISDKRYSVSVIGAIGKCL